MRKVIREMFPSSDDAAVLVCDRAYGATSVVCVGDMCYYRTPEGLACGEALMHLPVDGVAYSAVSRYAPLPSERPERSEFRVQNEVILVGTEALQTSLIYTEGSGVMTVLNPPEYR